MNKIEQLRINLRSAESLMRSARSDFEMVKRMNQVRRLRRELRMLESRLELRAHLRSIES